MTLEDPARMLTADSPALAFTDDQAVVDQHYDSEVPDFGVGTVRQVGSSDAMPAPDWDMLLVSWSRSTVGWEYAEDMRPAPLT